MKPEDVEFFKGTGWTAEQIERIKAQPRPALTINTFPSVGSRLTPQQIEAFDRLVRDAFDYPTQVGEARNNPQVLATPEGWVRLDEAGNFPPLTFRPEEWRMAGNEEMAKRLESYWVSVHTETLPLEPRPSWVMEDPADDIMSAVRAVARGS